MDLVNLISLAGKSFTDAMIAFRLPPNASQVEKDTYALELAKAIRFQEGGRAEEYLDHWLSGRATEKKFKLETLMYEDAGVRMRVTNEITRRALEIKTLRERFIDSRMSISSNAKRDRHIVTIFQKNYMNSDWHLALGTFPIDWEIIYETEDMIKVNAWGSNKYQWHPDSRRITQFLHQAGDRLAKNSNAAPANFEIVAEPIQLEISTRYRSVLKITTVTQTNPTHYKGMF